MKQLTILALALSFGLAATGCKKKESGPGIARPGDAGSADSGCCGTAPGPDGAIVPLGLVVLGLARITRRRRG